MALVNGLTSSACDQRQAQRRASGAFGTTNRFEHSGSRQSARSPSRNVWGAWRIPPGGPFWGQRQIIPGSRISIGREPSSRWVTVNVPADGVAVGLVQYSSPTGRSWIRRRDSWGGFEIPAALHLRHRRWGPSPREFNVGRFFQLSVYWCSWSPIPHRARVQGPRGRHQRQWDSHFTRRMFNAAVPRLVR